MDKQTYGKSLTVIPDMITEFYIIFKLEQRQDHKMNYIMNNIGKHARQIFDLRKIKSKIDEARKLANQESDLFHSNKFCVYDIFIIQ